MKISPMDKSFILYRCIHCGPLSPTNIEKMSTGIPSLPKEQLDRNKLFMIRLIDMYKSCAMLAIENGYVVGHVRFYPQIVFDRTRRKGICCQDPNASITQQMLETDFPAKENLSDRTLGIHCWLVHKDYRGQGLSHALLENLLEWARNNDWNVIKASASYDNHWISSQACALMLRTYMKYGFQKIKTLPSPELEERLIQFKEGKFGDKGKKEYNKFCAGKDLCELAVNHEVEIRL